MIVGESSYLKTKARETTKKEFIKAWNYNDQNLQNQSDVALFTFLKFI